VDHGDPGRHYYHDQQPTVATPVNKASSPVALQRSFASAKSSSLNDWMIDPSTLEAVAEGKLAAITRA
jgi:hypothetical protein